MADDTRYTLVSEHDIYAFENEDTVPNDPLFRNEGQLLYFYGKGRDVVMTYTTSSPSFFVLEPDMYAKIGRQGLKFHYCHNSSDDRRLDPSKSNIIDVYMLTGTYDRQYRNWLVNQNGLEPMPPTSNSLESLYSSSLEPIKAISDQIIYQSVKYKPLFGSVASRNLQATFKVVKNSTRSVSDNDVKSRILAGIESFFALENWDFGQTFYFSELTTYIMNLLAPDITNFIIVPKAEIAFGSLYEIACQKNEIFVNGATVSDIEIIDAITASQLKTTATVVSSSIGVY